MYLLRSIKNTLNLLVKISRHLHKNILLKEKANKQKINKICKY